jgi:hypothetical protein
MLDGALFIGWGAPIVGRETAGLDVFKAAKEFCEGLRKKNEITGFDTVLLSYVGGAYRGFFLLRGDSMKLANLITREDFVRLTTEASLVCENVTVAPAYVGDSVPQMIDTYRTAVNALALQHHHV